MLLPPSSAPPGHEPWAWAAPLGRVARERRWVPVVIIAATVLVALVGVRALGEDTHTITGTLELTDTDGFSAGGCHGSGGYSDIEGGTSVVVSDGKGATLATGTLEEGRTVSIFRCSFPFTVSGVGDADFYRVEVSHRGALTYSRKEMDARGWAVDVTLGL